MQEQLDIGDVLTTSFAVITKNIGTFLVFVGILIATGIVLAIGSAFAMRGMFAEIFQPGRAPDLQVMLRAYLTMLPFVGVATIVGMVVYSLAQAGMTFTAVEHLGGRTASVGGALSVAFRSFLPMIGATLVFGILLTIGLLCCIVPGIFVFLFFCLTTPAVVVERLGPLDALKRSAELTEGYKVTIFLLFLAITVAILVVSCCVFAPLGMITAMSNATPGMVPDPLSPGQLFVNFFAVIFRGFFTAYLTTVIAVVYARIRGIREGMDVAAFANIFA